MSCLNPALVAEDVAVHNEDIIGGRMKELLFGLTSTLPQTLPALYRLPLEVRAIFLVFLVSVLVFFFSEPARCL